VIRNYEDTRCCWGYISLCEKCVEQIKEQRRPGHINLNRIVYTMPQENVCEWCGKREEVK